MRWPFLLLLPLCVALPGAGGGDHSPAAHRVGAAALPPSAADTGAGPAPGAAPAGAPARPAPGHRASRGRVTTNCLDLAQVGPLQELVGHPLTTDGVAGTALAEAAAADPGVERLLRYLVECALPEDAALSIASPEGTVELAGSMGLTPEWRDGPCDEACQEWVSACMLARTNVYGIPVHIYMTGPHSALGTIEGTDLLDYSVEEGAFFGNLFFEPQRQYSCRGAGEDPFASTVRVCTKPGNLCGIIVAGACRGAPGDALCAWNEGGFFEDCRSRPPGGDEKVWSRVVTVHLRGTAFAAGQEAPCGTEGPAFEAPALPGGGFGAPCWNDTDCHADCAFCDASDALGRGVCSAGCKDAPDQADEQAACGGPGTTCLSSTGDGGSCTAACVAGAAPGDGGCSQGQVCTGLWPLREAADAPGCYPFCSSDADCPKGSLCYSRFGICGPAVDPAALPDGAGCVLPATGNGAPEIPCRGACFRVTDDPTQGVCGSFIDVRTTKECWDEPAHMAPIVQPGDDLGVCLWRSCTSDADCAPPLVCTGSFLAGKRCSWPP